jgi:hypothetical protein
MGKPIHNLSNPIPKSPTSLPHGFMECGIPNLLIINTYQNPLTIISQRKYPLKKKNRFK